MGALVTFPPPLSRYRRRNTIARQLNNQHPAANSVFEKIADERLVQRSDVLSDALAFGQIQSEQHSKRDICVLIRRGLLSVIRQEGIKRGIVGLPLDLGDDPNPKRIARLKNEVEAISTLKHPNVVPLVDNSAFDALPSEKDRQFLVMPVAEGGNLTDAGHSEFERQRSVGRDRPGREYFSDQVGEAQCDWEPVAVFRACGGVVELMALG
jgi:hypothetical protein